VLLRPALFISLACGIVLAACDPVGPDPDPATAHRLIRGNDEEQWVEVGQPITLAVRLVDGRGAPIAGATVLWQVTSGGARIEPASAQTSADGVASATLLPERGENRVVARIRESTLSIPFAVHGCSGCGKWAGVTPLPEPRVWASALVARGKLWVIGGEDMLDRSTSIEVLELSDFTWRQGASLPVTLSAPSLATVQDQIYVIGGNLDPFPSGWLRGITNVNAFDPATGEWTDKRPLLHGRFFAASAVLGGKIYVAGGHSECHAVEWCEEPPLASLEIYDPAVDRWTDGPPMSQRRANAGAAVLDDKLYVAGGTAGDSHMFDQPTASVEMFDPLTNRWSRRADLPAAGSVRLATVDGKLHALVSWMNEQSARLFSYDPAADVWTHLRVSPTPGFGAAVAADDSSMYVVGGYARFSPYWVPSACVYAMRR
jgi:hypothetical protein